MSRITNMIVTNVAIAAIAIALGPPLASHHYDTR